MRPTITRAPGDAENNCPTYAFLSGDNSTPSELTTAEERQGMTIKDVGEEYLLSPVVAKKIVLALGVSKETINQIDVYDETDIENIFSVLLKHGRTYPLKTIYERAHFLPEHIVNCPVVLEPAATIGGIDLYAEDCIDKLRHWKHSLFLARESLSAEDRHARSKIYQKRYRAKLRALRGNPTATPREVYLAASEALHERERPGEGWQSTSELKKITGLSRKQIIARAKKWGLEIRQHGTFNFIKDFKEPDNLKPPENYYTIQDAISRVNYAETTLRNWCRDNKVPNMVFNGKLYIDVSAIMPDTKDGGNNETR